MVKILSLLVTHIFIAFSIDPFTGKIKTFFDCYETWYQWVLWIAENKFDKFESSNGNQKFEKFMNVLYLYRASHF